MNKINIWVIRLKNYTLPLIFLIFALCLVLFSSTNLSAAKTGLTLWATSVVPSLFPFFIATELLIQTNMPYILGRFLKIFMKPLFNISGEGSFAFIMGVISGYPTGATIASNFRKNNILTKQECERLLSFTNNSGPLFIIGTVGISMFGSSTIGFLLFITHLLASISVGIIFRFWKKDEQNSDEIKHYIQKSKTVTFSNLGEVIATSIKNATSTILLIGGFVVLFSVIISILKTSNVLGILSNMVIPSFNLLHIPTNFITPFLTGILEITNGISLISKIQIKILSINILFSAFLLGFGGISVLLQVLSITSKTDLSIKPYILGKILHGILATIYTFLFINFIPFFNFNL